MWLVWIRRKIDKFYFEWRKKRGSQNAIKKLVADDKKITDQTHIWKHIREFYTTIFKTLEQKTAIEMGKFFSDADIPKLSETQAKLCEEGLNEKDLYNSLKSLQVTNLQVMID